MGHFSTVQSTGHQDTNKRIALKVSPSTTISMGICVAWLFIDGAVNCTLDLWNVTCTLDPALRTYLAHKIKCFIKAGCHSRNSLAAFSLQFMFIGQSFLLKGILPIW